MNHVVSAMLVAEHLGDLLREAENDRRANLVRGARRSAWDAFSDRLAGLRRRSEGDTRRDLPASTSAGTHPAAA